MVHVTRDDAVRAHVERLRTLATELEREADALGVEFEAPRHLRDTDPAPPPESPWTALLDRACEQMNEALAAAMGGDFACAHCSAQGPHTQVISADSIGFRCVRCGRSLGPNEIRLAVFATLARMAAERHLRGEEGPT